MLSTFILVVHTLIAIALVGVILIQRSEGGGLGIGSGPTGLMSARGAANLLTRATTVLAGLFIGTSILLAVLASQGNKARPIDTSLAKPVESVPGPATPTTPAPGALPGLPVAQPVPAPQPAPATDVPTAK